MFILLAMRTRQGECRQRRMRPLSRSPPLRRCMERGSRMHWYTARTDAISPVDVESSGRVSLLSAATLHRRHQGGVACLPAPTLSDGERARVTGCGLQGTDKATAAHRSERGELAMASGRGTEEPASRMRLRLQLQRCHDMREAAVRRCKWSQSRFWLPCNRLQHRPVKFSFRQKPPTSSQM